MPQETNLNVAPYFDDFTPESNYYRVLFKPGFPVQARELNSLQSILQNQVEDMGNHFFKEGAKIIPGDLLYKNNFFSIQIQDEFLGIPVSLYVDQLVGKTITGATSGVTATVVTYITDEESEKGNYTLYLNYYNTSQTDSETVTFGDGEILTVGSEIVFASTFIAAGEGFATCVPQNASARGAAFILNSGVYFLRGTFVDVHEQILILDQYSNRPNNRVGLTVIEEIITPDDDPLLNDNARGFNNYTAPGADRLKISAFLSKKGINEFNTENFIQLAEVVDGNLRILNENTDYNYLSKELARRTYDESGHYYIRDFVTTVRESLNNEIGNKGIYKEGQTTYQGNTPSENLMVYKVSPGKAYVKGYEVDIVGPTLLDAPKPRTTKNIQNQAINFGFGPTFVLNNVEGSPQIGINTSQTVSLRGQRLAGTPLDSVGEEIGRGRIYDFALESGAYDATFPETNKWDLSLWDITMDTTINVNENVTLSIPTYVKGESSGATGYLKTAVAAGAALTVTETQGSFVPGENLIFNGIVDNSRFVRTVLANNISDVQSVRSTVGTAQTFVGDVVLKSNVEFGNGQVTGASAGVSTVTVPSNNELNFVGILTTNDIVQYSRPGQELVSFGRVTVVNRRDFQIDDVPSVSGVVNGALPGSDEQVSNIRLMSAPLAPNAGGGNPAGNESLYTTLSKNNVESVDLQDSTLVIRKQFDVTIAGNQMNPINAGSEEVFLPFDEERYTLLLEDGSTEVLTQDRFEFTNGSTTLQINNLATNGPGKLIATLRKSKVTSKTKLKIVSENIIINKSVDPASGIGSTTLNDGLEFGAFPFGTNVQDSIICLNHPDLYILYGVYESADAQDPACPRMTLGSMDGPTGTTDDLIIGDVVSGSISGAKAYYLVRDSQTEVSFIYINQEVFEKGEVLTFAQSGVNAVATNITSGSPNVTKSFNFNGGQEVDFYNYSSLVRRETAQVPSRKLRVYYGRAFYDTSDKGEITTVNSYTAFNYDDEIAITDGCRASDIIDARPRVAQYTVTSGARSPFEFEGRSFDTGNNGNLHSSKFILASEESMTMNFNYYLGRIDRIYVDPERTISVVSGVPDDEPRPPAEITGQLNIANVYLPPYLYDTGDAKVTFIQHKRYQMSDISELEKRISNIEYYTSLNLLETETLNLFIEDANGNNKFKSGVSVDNFSTLSPQDFTVGVRNSIHKKKNLLRPAHYTTAMQLELATDAITGIGTTTLVNQDNRFATLLGNNIRRNNQILTLDYADVVFLRQPYGTRTESVTPFIVREWVGRMTLEPDTDIWVETNRLEPRNVEQEGTFDTIASFLEAEVNTAADGTRVGVSPVIWESWETTGVNVDLDVDGDANTEFTENTQFERVQTGSGMNGRWGWRTFDETTTITRTATTTNNIQISGGTSLEQQRRGNINTINEFTSTESLGDRIVNREVIHFTRQRNIEVTAQSLKPFTKMFAFFDGEDVNRFMVPKLLQIQMSSGTFEVGETVVGRMNNNGVEIQVIGTTPRISFRVATPNQKFGPYNAPTDVYDSNPYDRETPVETQYTQTSTILNVDTFSLASENFPDFRGWVRQGMIFTGQTSGAQATLTDVQLITDRVGTLQCSFQIPDSSIPINPAFETGRNVFRLTNSSINTQVPGNVSSSAEETFFSQGDVETTQEVTLSVRNARINTETLTEERVVNGGEVTADDLQIVSVAQDVDVETVQTRETWFDPLAQTFQVADEAGVFMSKVDLFFSEKDLDGIPVTIQLRTTQLGTPTEVVIPLSEVIVDPSDITVSDNGTVATTVEFNAPVYLNPQTQYCLVLFSVSPNYRVWISRLGEPDVSTIGTEAGQVLVTQQPTLGSLFKSQNASTWTPSQYEDLKFTLYSCEFVPSGTLSFVNPSLSEQMAVIPPDGLTINSRSVKIGIGSTVVDADLEKGNTVFQDGTDQAQGTLVALGGSATSDLSITNAGVGYTPSAAFFTYTGVALTSVTGTGLNATADITVAGGIAIGATIVAGGRGYQVGDVLTPIEVGNQNLGRGMKLSVQDIFGENTLELTDVQGTFIQSGTEFVKFINSSGVTTDLNSTQGGGVPITSITPTVQGDSIKVFQRNHGMYSDVNDVVIRNVKPSYVPTVLDNNFSSTDTTFIQVSSVAVAELATYENVSVASSNPGYVVIGSEIVKYTGVDGNTLTGVTRGIDDTKPQNHAIGELVYKYELDGVSLLRINRTHELDDYTGVEPITLDTYNLTIDMGAIVDGDTINVNRAPGNADGMQALYFNQNTQAGGPEVTGTYNVPFTQIVPRITNVIPSGTSITNSIRTISGTSVNGFEASYIDQGYKNFVLGQNVYFETPRIVASDINESQLLDPTVFTGSKSLQIIHDFNTKDTRVSPVIDMDNASVVFTSNRINNPVSDYATDPRVNTVSEDPNRFVYVTKNIVLENPATSLQVLVDAYVSDQNDVRAFFALNQGDNLDDVIFTPFPGYSNLDSSGAIIDTTDSNGQPDIKVPKQDQYTSKPSSQLFREYKFTIDQKVSFRSFRVKLVGTSVNQAIVPQFRNFRTISFA